MEHEDLIRKHLGVNTPDWIVANVQKAIDEALRSTLIIKTMEYEYRDRDWEMWVEGSSDNKPKESDIVEHAKSKGFELKNIEIWFDNFQKFWRFNANLVRL